MGYELRCKICPWAGGQGPQPEQDPACYFGETGQNMHTRIKVHESKFKSKLLRICEGSAFYIHMMNKHSDVEIEGKSLDPFFEVNILKAYQKVLTRLVDEGTNLISHDGPILNSKTEWHQPKIIRNIIIQGGAETAGVPMGRRPSPSPQTAPASITPANNVASSAPTGVSTRSTRGITRVTPREGRARGQ